MKFQTAERTEHRHKRRHEWTRRSRCAPGYPDDADTNLAIFAMELLATQMERLVHAAKALMIGHGF